MAATKTKTTNTKKKTTSSGSSANSVPGQRQEPVQVRQAQEKREPKELLKLLM